MYKYFISAKIACTRLAKEDYWNHSAIGDFAIFFFKYIAVIYFQNISNQAVLMMIGEYYKTQVTSTHTECCKRINASPVANNPSRS